MAVLKYSIFFNLLVVCCMLGFGCLSKDRRATNASIPEDWASVRQLAQGSKVTIMMWQGDPVINSFMQSRVVPYLKDSFDITLDIISGQGNEVVQLLMSELETDQSKSQVDLCWINGETFYQLRSIQALHGPWVDLLPNAKHIDWKNPFIAKDFQRPIEGYECPWGNVQMTFIYNKDKVSNPPQSMKDWKTWMIENPGKFTWTTDFTGMTLLKTWLIALSGDKEAFKGDFNEGLYNESSKELFKYLDEIRPYLWNEGKSFPKAIAQMHQLFANGQLYMTMSNNDSEVDNKVSQGVFPKNSFGYVPEHGTIRNSHYLGIPVLAPNKAGAMVVANTLISPRFQHLKMQPAIWGDGPVLETRLLDSNMKMLFETVPGRSHVPPRDSLIHRAIEEPAAEYMIRLAKDFDQWISQ